MKASAGMQNPPSCAARARRLSADLRWRIAEDASSRGGQAVWWAVCLLWWASVFAAGEPAETHFDWRQALEAAPGVRYTRTEREWPHARGLTCPYYPLFNPEAPRRARVVAVRVDSRHPGVGFAATARDERWGERMPDPEGQGRDLYVIRTRRRTTAEFVRRQQESGRRMVLGVNAAPWRGYGLDNRHLYADQLGLAVANGVIVSYPNGRPSLIVDVDGQLDMRVVKPDEPLDRVRVAVSGFSFCLVNGKPRPPDTVLHPRTGFGLCVENRYLYLAVVDGRQADSQGATGRELGEWLRYYGAHTGINMDGGGSSTLVLCGLEDGMPVVANSPCFGPRRNGGNFGVYIAGQAALDASPNEESP